jgi:hypothetical protein
MKFEMPQTSEDQIAMHSAMLQRVQAARQNIAQDQSGMLQQLKQKSALGFDVREDMKTFKKLRLQELCLVNQEIRLQERIERLQTGS